MTPFQEQLIEALRVAPNKQESTTRLAYKLKTSRLAVVSSMRSLERRGLVGMFRMGRDQWATQAWGLRKDPKDGHA